MDTLNAPDFCRRANSLGHDHTLHVRQNSSWQAGAGLLHNIFRSYARGDCPLATFLRASAFPCARVSSCIRLLPTADCSSDCPCMHTSLSSTSNVLLIQRLDFWMTQIQGRPAVCAASASPRSSCSSGTITLIDMGTHLLKNVSGSQLLVQAAVPGVEDRCRWLPGLRSISLSPGASCISALTRMVALQLVHPCNHAVHTAPTVWSPASLGLLQEAAHVWLVQ